MGRKLLDLIAFAPADDGAGGGAGAGAGGAGAGGGNKPLVTVDVGAGGDKGKDAGAGGAVDKGKDAGAGGDKGQPPVTPEAYRPTLPKGFEALLGKSDKESIDKLSSRLVEIGLPPEKPDLYKLELPEDFTKKFGKLDKDPAVDLWRDIAHKRGLSDKVFSGVIQDLYDGMISKGMMEQPVDAEAEQRKLGNPKSDPSRQLVEGAQRIQGIADNFAALVNRGVITRTQANILLKPTTTADGVAAMESLIKLLSPGDGIRIGGQAPQGATAESVAAKRRDPRYLSTNKEYDPAFRAQVDAEHRSLFGAKG